MKYRTGFNDFNIMKVVCIVKNADNYTKINLLGTHNDYESIEKQERPSYFKAPAIPAEIS